MRQPSLPVAVLLSVIVLGACGSNRPVAGEPEPYEGTELSGAAPDFSLADQDGATIQLSELNGRVVVLAFLDPHCTDICPLTAQHVRSASTALGDQAPVDFLAINVNDGFSEEADIAQASAEWGMSDVPNWHFLTGTPEELRSARDAWGMFAEASKPEHPDQVVHSPGIYIIGPDGQRRWYLSTAFDSRLPLGDMIVERVRDLLDEPRPSSWALHSATGS
ncbi:MAG: SCO family protein [Chloroflexi bacterium]|nr:SCO family protein [Chloroflexota bacterium]